MAPLVLESTNQKEGIKELLKGLKNSILHIRELLMFLVNIWSTQKIPESVDY